MVPGVVALYFLGPPRGRRGVLISDGGTVLLFRGRPTDRLPALGSLGGGAFGVFGVPTFRGFFRRLVSASGS